PFSPSAKPRLDPQSCPAEQNWTEGQEEILECRSRGHPDPVLECSRDGHSMDPGIPHLADRAQAGLYLCRARNELGTAERNVTLRVLCESGGFGGEFG
ncbi:ICAM1 protein, partial [Vireo altiloquus]|nr:ICAM1 protein [Vireo altiloquus]